ncbi:MAG: MFS transporter [Ignavibacteriaceae bacterium]
MTLKKIPRQVVILGFVSLFTDIASEMLYPITPIFLTAALGASMATVGIIEGLAEFTAGFLKGYFGRLSDKLKKRSIFVTAGYGLSALSKPLPGIFPFIPAVVFSRVADRVGKGMRTAPRDALLAANADGNTGAIFGFHRGMDTLGAALGPVAALILLHFYPHNYILIFLVAFFPSVIAVSFSSFVKDKIVERKVAPKFKYFEFWKTAPAQYKHLIYLVTLFSFVNSSDVFLILKSKNISHSSSLAITGYIFYNLIYAASSYPIGKLADRIGKSRVFVIGLFIFSLVYFGFAVSPDFQTIWALFILYGIYAASTEGVAKAWVSDLILDENRGSAIGLLTMLSSFAIMIGSFFTGVLWDKFGSSIPFLVSSAVSFFVAFAFIFFKLRKNPVNAH